MGEAIPFGCLLMPPSKHLFTLSLVYWNVGSRQEFDLGPASPKDSPTPLHTYSSLHPTPATRENGEESRLPTEGSLVHSFQSLPASLFHNPSTLLLLASFLQHSLLLNPGLGTQKGLEKFITLDQNLPSCTWSNPGSPGQPIFFFFFFNFLFLFLFFF